MLTIVSVFLIFGAVANLFIMVWVGKKVTTSMIFGLGTVAIFGGWAISNLNLASLRMTPGSLSAQMQSTVTQVNTRADEVEALTEKMEKLAQSIERTKSDVAESKQQVSGLVAEARQTEESVKSIERGLRQITKATLYPNMYLVAEVKTLWGIPRGLYDDIEKNIDIIAAFAYPNKKERDQEIGKIKDRMPGSPGFGH